MYYWINGAQEGTRTPTPLTEPAPEAGASTNFATWATRVFYNILGKLSRKKWLLCTQDFGYFIQDGIGNFDFCAIVKRTSQIHIFVDNNGRI